MTQTVDPPDRATAPRPPRLRFRNDADFLEALCAGAALAAAGAPEGAFDAHCRAIVRARAAARRRGVSFALEEVVAADGLDADDFALLVLFLRAALDARGGVLSFSDLAAALAPRDLGGRLALRRRLDETSALRAPGLLESDASDDLESRKYRLAPRAVERLLPGARLDVRDPDTRRGPDEALAAALGAATELVVLQEILDRGVGTWWATPLPGGGWDRLGVARAELARHLEALRDAVADPLGRAIAEHGLDAAEAVVLALVVDATARGLASLPAGLAARLAFPAGSGADPSAVLGRGGRLVRSGLLELPSGDVPLAFGSLALTAAARVRLRIPAPPAAAKRDEENENLPALERRTPAHRLADVVLSPSDRARVEELLFRLGDGAALLRAWGVESGPGGAAALFFGPPGTGKTYTAEALAAELGRPLVRLRVEGALSRWVGAGEQRVAAAFREAAAEGAVLLLDEADSLLADRAEARSWQVPLVNLLLVEIERYPGLVVLATNRAAALDPALERRLALRLELGPPGEAERAELWRRHLPAALPLAPDVDLRALARAHALTGSGIRRACTQAALRAASRPPEARLVSQADLAAAAAGSSAPPARPLGFRPVPAPRPEPRKLSAAA